MLRLLSLCLVCLLGCTPAPATPKGATGPVLGVTERSGGPVAQGPVAVTYYAPSGEADTRAQISVAFDRSMVALGAEVATDVLRIEPRVPGRARWIGSQTLVFEPASPLPSATRFQVRVPAGMVALDGQKLSEELSFSFVTPAPAVARTEPYDGAERELPSRGFELFFNQAVAPERLAPWLSVQVHERGKARAIEVRVSRPDEADLRHVRVQPVNALPMGAKVVLRLGAGLVGEEGPRPMERAFTSQFSVYGPLEVARDACQAFGGRCSPHGGAVLMFTNPVKVGEALARLRFTPALPEPLRVEGHDYVSEHVYLGQPLAPLTRYTVHIEGELEDVFGNRLTGPRKVTLQTGPYEPWARIAADGEVLVAGGRASLPVQLTNLAAPRATVMAVSRDELEGFASGRLSLPPKRGTTVTLEPAGPRERRLVALDLAPLLQEGKGLLWMQITDAKRPREVLAQKLVAVTDLSPTLKVGSRSGLVWVTELSTARAVKGAEVRLVDCGRDVARGKTDAAGLLRFTLEKPPECELFAVVEKQGDVSFAHQYAGVGPWELTSRYGFASDGPSEAFLFSERGVYRPGETLRLKGMLRTRDGTALKPARGSAALRVADSQDREISETEVALSDFGSFAQSVRIPGSAALGPLNITVRHGTQTFHGHAELAEYRPQELDVSVQAREERVVQGERAQLTVRGHYLFGAPLSAQRVIWSARRVGREQAPPGERYEGFTFGDETRWFEEMAEQEETTLLGGEGKLDARGELDLEIPADLSLAAGTAGLEVEATVEGMGGVAASARSVLTVTPAAFLVGVKPETSLLTAGRAFAVRLVAAKLTGEPVSQAALEASLTRRVFTTDLKAGPAGRSEYVHGHRDEAVGSCRVRTRAGFGECSLLPKLPGLHFLRVRGQDAAGRTVSAAVPVYVAGEGGVSWPESDRPTITLKADRARYRVGERAKILVASPFEAAEALVTVEREGVISVERQRIEGGASTLEIPVDERFVPNAFVSVVLVRPGHDAVSPAYRVGSVELVADASVHHLGVEVKLDAPEKRPGDTLDVQLAVRDGAGQPVQAELTVFAVDEGVLSLTGYRTPDPFEVFYAPKGLSVWTADARGRLLRDLSTRDDKGGSEGGGGGGGMALRKDFDAVAFYAPEVLTDEAGKARVSFRLPDSLTRYRVMAVASSRGTEVGAGEATVRTKKPLMVRPALPRVIRVGDAFQAGGVVHNDSERALDVVLRAEVEGVLLDGSAERRVRVPAASSVDVRFDVRADTPGEARLRFVAQAGRERDALEVRRPVLLTAPLEAVSSSGEAQQPVREALGSLAGVRRDVGGLELTVSTSVLSQLAAPAQALLEYPYACTEQLASRLIGLAAQTRLAAREVIELRPFKELAAPLLAELERHQRSDGSFGLWSSEDRDLPPPLAAFLTSYALLALDALERAELARAEHAAGAARGFLASFLRAERPGVAADLDAASVTFAVYALARTGHVDVSYAGTLRARQNALPLSGKVQLAHVLSLAGDVASARGLLEQVFTQLRVTADEAHLEENLGDSYEVLLASDVRGTAQLLLLLSALEPDHALLPRLARWLVAARELDGTWGTTQENAWGLLALSAYAEAREQPRRMLRATLRLDDRSLGSARLEGARASQRFEVPMAELPSAGASLSITPQGDSPFYYTMRLRYARAEPARTPEERGMFVERLYERVDPVALSRGDSTGTQSLRAQAGDYVRVTLRVAVPSTRRFVLIEDSLPAGLEPVNFGWLTEARAAERALGHRQAPFDHRELRDTHVVFSVNQLEPGLYQYRYLARASTPGRFTVPPAQASEMYHPETFGRTAASQFEVLAP